MEAIKLEGISKTFGALMVLQDLSLTVQAGEHVAIIGPNGAGKTTLINVIGGELQATAGRIYLLGQEVTNMPIYRRAHIGLSRSFQTTRVFNSLTLIDNMTLAVQGVKSSRYQMFRSATGYNDVITTARKLLESTNLWQKKDELVKDISYGEQRSMEIILSLASEPKVLLLDEPSAGLGIAESLDFVDMIRALAKDVTVIFTEHDMDVVFGLADRVIVLYYGAFIADGSPEEIQANLKVQEIYLGAKRIANARSY
jgi:branched-chain amino acid transport system ATP-binding protein